MSRLRFVVCATAATVAMQIAAGLALLLMPARAQEVGHTCVAYCDTGSAPSPQSPAGPVIVAPQSPSPEQLDAEQRAKIEAGQRLEEQQRRQSEAEFVRERDRAAHELKGVAGESGLKGTDTSALHQLPSAAAAGVAASSAGVMAAKPLSGSVFDTAGSSRPDAIAVPKIGGGEPPAAAALRSQIGPEGMKDAQIQQMFGEFAKLERTKADKQQALASVQKQIDSGNGDAAVLTAQKGTLENDLKRIDSDQQNAKNEIGKRLVDRGLTWNEGN